MLRSFHPTFETLEKREVFSAGPLAGFQLATAGHGAGDPIPAESISINFAAGATQGRGSAAYGVVNDGNLDAALQSPRSGLASYLGRANNHQSPSTQNFGVATGGNLSAGEVAARDDLFRELGMQA